MPHQRRAAFGQQSHLDHRFLFVLLRHDLLGVGNDGVVGYAGRINVAVVIAKGQPSSGKAVHLLEATLYKEPIG